MAVRNRQIYIWLFVILTAAAMLRFYRLSEMANFDFDQEYASNFAYFVLKEYPIQLIGQGLSIQGLFMGPLYFYYFVPFFALTNLHPIGGYVGSVFLGLMTVFVYFWVGKKMFGVEAGLIAAFFRSFLFSFAQIDWTLTPAFSSDILVIITLYLFYRLWQKNKKALIYLAFCFGLFTSFHPILFPFYLVLPIIFLLKKILPKPKILLFSAIAFIVPIIPLIRFEFLHNFLEVKQLFALFNSHSQDAKNHLTSLVEYLNINLYEPYRIFGISNIPKQFFVSFLFLPMLPLIIKRVGFWKDGFHKTFLAATFFSFILYYLLFPGHVSEYYFSAISVLIVFYTAASLSLLAKKSSSLLVALLIIISLFNFKLFNERWNDRNLMTLYHKDFIVKEILNRQPKNQDFFVSYIKYPGWNFGFDYLFKLYGHIPQTKEVKPPIYTIVIPKGLSEGPGRITSGNINLILPQY